MADLLDFIPVWIRALFAVALISLGAFWAINGYRDYESITAEERSTMTAADAFELQNAKTRFQGGIVLTLLGGGLLALSSRSNSEKNGYRSV